MFRLTLILMMLLMPSLSFGWPVSGSIPNVVVDDVTIDGDIDLTATSTNQILLPLSNDAVTPTLAFGDGNTGIYESADNTLSFAFSGVERYNWSVSNFKSADTGSWNMLRAASSDTVPAYAFTGDTDTGAGTSGADSLSLIAGGVEGIRITEATTVQVKIMEPVLTAGSDTGLTVNDTGSLRTQLYKVTLAKENFDTAATNHDVTIATMPAKTIIHSVIADVTTAFTCTGVCTTATLSAFVGITAGGVEFLVEFDLDAATATFGDGDAEVGDNLDIAGNTNGGYPHWAGTTIVLRATSGTGNWGNGSATNLSDGAVTVYILYSVLP